MSRVTFARWARTLAIMAIATSVATAGHAQSGEAYDGPTLFTDYHAVVDESQGGALDYMFGFSKWAPNKRLSIFVRANLGARTNIATGVVVKLNGTWEVTLPTPQQMIAMGNKRTLTFLICSYIEGAAGVNPLDPNTLDCGPNGPSTSHDLWMPEEIAISNASEGTKSFIAAVGGDPALYEVRNWFFDGSDPADNPMDVGGATHAFASPGYVTAAWWMCPLMVCSVLPPIGSDMPSALIQANASPSGHGVEFKYNYAGVFAIAPNRSVVSVRTVIRADISPLPSPAQFEVDFNEAPSFGTGCNTIAGDGPTAANALFVLAIASPALVARIRRWRGELAKPRH